MSMRDGMLLFKEKFQILARSDGLGFRFIAPPYTDAESDSIKILGHNRDPERLSALSIVAILTKFGITEEAFKSGYNELYAATQRRSIGTE